MWPFLHSDDSTVVLNVKDDARVGQKTALACGHRASHFRVHSLYKGHLSIDNCGHFSVIPQRLQFRASTVVSSVKPHDKTRVL